MWGQTSNWIIKNKPKTINTETQSPFWIKNTPDLSTPTHQTFSEATGLV